MKKHILIIILLFVSITPIFSLTIGKKEIKIPTPTAELKKVEIEKISLRDIDFIFYIEISNPYPIKLNLDDVMFTFFVEDKQFFKTNTRNGLGIKAKNKKITEFRVNIKYMDIINIVKDYSKKEYLDCRSDVRLVIPLPKMSGLPKNITFDFSAKNTLPAVKPKISIAQFKVQKPSLAQITDALNKQKKKANASDISDMFADILSGKPAKKIIDPASLDIPIKIDFDIVLQNETAHKLIFNNLNYDFFIGKDKLVTGLTKDIEQKNNASIITVSNTFSSKQLSKSVMSFFNKGSGDFMVKGNTKLELPKKISQSPLNLDFAEGGQFSIK
ncbi:MAG: LEA type 2 family protein [Spirochaetes bacterium]|nr:LEA type 2 family protein [Spirochaetota bacterium]